MPGVGLRNKSRFILIWTFCLTKMRNVQTSVHFGWKMSNVRLLFFMETQVTINNYS